MRRIDRFDEYMAHANLNDNKVTQQLGLSVGTIGKSRKEGRDLSDRVIEQILNFYTDLNKVWLLTGEGNMIGAKRKIPLYDDPTIGGVNELAANVDDSARPAEWIDAGDWFPTATSAIHHYGESMVEYPSGGFFSPNSSEPPLISRPEGAGTTNKAASSGRRQPVVKTCIAVRRWLRCRHVSSRSE